MKPTSKQMGSRRPSVLFTSPSEYALTYADWEKDDQLEHGTSQSKNEKEPKVSTNINSIYGDYDIEIPCDCEWMDILVHCVRDHFLVECAMMEHSS